MKVHNIIVQFAEKKIGNSYDFFFRKLKNELFRTTSDTSLYSHHTHHSTILLLHIPSLSDKDH